MVPHLPYSNIPKVPYLETSDSKISNLLWPFNYIRSNALLLKTVFLKQCSVIYNCGQLMLRLYVECVPKAKLSGQAANYSMCANLWNYYILEQGAYWTTHKMLNPLNKWLPITNQCEYSNEKNFTSINIILNQIKSELRMSMIILIRLICFTWFYKNIPFYQALSSFPNVMSFICFS